MSFRFKNLSTSNLSSNSEKEVSIKDFGGVDYSHSTLFVDTSRAVSMSNFIKEDGINQKRKGFREIYQFSPIITKNETMVDVAYKKINGVWELTISKFNSNNKSYDLETNIIIQADSHFYAMTKSHIEKDVDGNATIIKENGITTEANDYDSQYTLEAELIKEHNNESAFINANNVSYGIVADERLYVLTGSLYVMIGKFDKELQVRKVEDDEHTYIPVTTKSIPPNEYNHFLEDKKHVLNPATQDQVNMLHRKRINKLHGLDEETLKSHVTNYHIYAGGLTKDENGNYIDSSGKIVNLRADRFLKNKYEEFIDNPLIYTYNLDSIPFTMGHNEEIDMCISEAISKLEVSVNGTITTPFGDVLLEDVIAERVSDKKAFHTAVDGLYKKKEALLYYVEYKVSSIEDGIPYGTCTITFNYNVVPNKLENPISVLYERYIKSADKINACRIGCMYGLKNQVDHLFVSGNPQFPNMDYHTIEANTLEHKGKTASYQASLTYFGDLSYTKIGGSSNAINGYAILGDGKMAILKVQTGQEPTIYYRTASTISEQTTDINGNSYTKITEIYPIQVGTIGEGSIGYNTIQNLNGDTLMVSSGGVFGIELDSNVASSQRFARRRSRVIDPLLKNYDLSKAVCTVFNDKFYLCLSEGKVLIADARYPIKLKDDLNNEYNYEWWEWNGIDARLFFIINNQLWFGTSTGMLCCFEEKNYKDTTVLDIEKTGICYVEDDSKNWNDKFIVSPMYISSLENMSSNDIFISSNDIYALGFETNLENVTVYGNKIIYNYSNIKPEEKQQHILFLLSIPNYVICFDEIIDNDQSIMLKQEYTFSSVMNDSEKEEITFEVYERQNTEKEVWLNNKGFRVCLKINKEEPHSICNVGTYINKEYLLFCDYRENDGKYYFIDNEGVTTIELESRPQFNHFSIRDYTREGNPLKIINYNKVVPIIDCGKFIFNKNVNCHYITPPFDMGTKHYNKDLHKLIMVPDTLLGTSVDFGFKTSNYSKDFNAYTGRAFSFNELDFDNLNFLSESFAKVYVKTAKKKRWSYIQFFFKSDTNNNCKINNLTIIYSIGTKNKGVR